MDGDEKIRIYALENPLIWIENEELLFRTILKAVNPSFSFSLNKNFIFHISPTCGWLSFERKDQLWTKFQKALIQDAIEVKKVAHKFLRTLAVESLSNEFKAKKIPPILPNSIDVKLIHNSTRLVTHFELALLDHWLVTFSFQLRKNKEDSVFYPLEDCTITIRIGYQNDVIGFYSQWRPTFLKSSEEKFIHEHKDESHSNHNEDKTVVYELYGENDFQNYILPFYKSAETHHANYTPASESSFTIALTESFTLQEDNLISINILGGSGAFVYSVYAYKPDEVFNSGYFKVTEGSFKNGDTKFTLPKAVYNLIVWVADIKTGVIKKHEQSIYSLAEVIEENNIDTPILT